MKISTAFPTKFLKASDLQGKEVKVEIDDCRMEDVAGDGSEEKPVLYFKGKNKGLVMNKTNAGKLEVAFGDDTEHWSGRTIILYPDVTQFQGRTVDCLRVRVPAPKAADGEPTPF